MDWTDEGFVLSARPFGEGSAIVELLTSQHGRHAGLLKGGRTPSRRGALEPGTRVRTVWRGRFAENLGSWSGLEPLRHHAAGVMDDATRLAALAAVCAVAAGALPEREPHPEVFAGTEALFAVLDAGGDDEVWAAAYVRWELDLLAALGFGLDLARCAATGRNDMLAWVSPRTGRAVSLAAGEAYKDRLLALPGFLVGRGDADAAALRDGLHLTAHFLQSCLFDPLDRPLPAARGRLAELVGVVPKPTRGAAI
ncbi:MAG: DNA repair protein RecO [Alphaproteobacteria bacterium]|nr:DNA repair protein RecO [Alphaproteobacteria bacterium]